MLIKTIRKAPYGRVLLVDCTTARVLHKIASPNSCTVIQNRKASSFFFTFHNKWTQSHAGDCFLSKFEKKEKEKKSPTVLQSPSLSWSIIIRCQRCWSWWHSENTKIFKVAESPDAVCSMQCTTGITEPGGHILFLPASRPGIDVRSSILERPPVSDTHTHTHWVHMSVSKCEPSLGLQNDAGALVLFFALEGGVCLLQIVNHGQQPRSDALMTRLH